MTRGVKVRDLEIFDFVDSRCRSSIFLQFVSQYLATKCSYVLEPSFLPHLDVLCVNPLKLVVSDLVEQ